MASLALLGIVQVISLSKGLFCRVVLAAMHFCKPLVKRIIQHTRSLSNYLSLRTSAHPIRGASKSVSQNPTTNMTDLKYYAAQAINRPPTAKATFWQDIFGMHAPPLGGRAASFNESTVRSFYIAISISVTTYLALPFTIPIPSLPPNIFYCNNSHLPFCLSLSFPVTRYRTQRPVSARPYPT